MSPKRTSTVFRILDTQWNGMAPPGMESDNASSFTLFDYNSVASILLTLKHFAAIPGWWSFKNFLDPGPQKRKYERLTPALTICYHCIILWRGLIKLTEEVENNNPYNDNADWYCLLNDTVLLDE